MIIVIATAAGALLALKAYNGTKAADPELLDRVLFGVKQQAGVMAAICAAVFSVIAALQTGKSPSSTVVTSTTTPIFGARSSSGGLAGQLA